MTNSSKWSFSVPLGGPCRTSFGDHFGPHLETISDLILDRKLTRGDSISNSETSIRTQMRTRNSNSANRARQFELDPSLYSVLTGSNSIFKTSYNSNSNLSPISSSPSNANSNSNRHARTRTQTRTRHPTRTRARARNPSRAELPLHFFSGITEARTGGELELLRKPSPLGDERGSVREIGLWN